MKWSRRTDEKFNGFMDKTTSCTGELKFEGTFRIDGKFQGSISTKHTLIIGASGDIQADVTAGEVKIYGSLSGNVVAARRVEIGATGRLRGDVRTAQLTIEDGAVFEGRSYRGSEEGKLEPATETTVAAAGRLPEAAPEPEKPLAAPKTSQPEKADFVAKMPDTERPNPTKRRWVDDFQSGL